jgi:virginiamycin A acetyltransferase
VVCAGAGGRAGEGQMLSDLLVWLYGYHRMRSFVVRVTQKLEGGEFRSRTLRRIFARYWDVEIGMYTHGGCFVPWMVDPKTKIGRYCSIASGVRIINHNHPLAFKGTSGLFFNPLFGVSERWLIEHRPLEVGNDVWIGANAVIMPEVNRIGDGAVIGAGAVVNRDIPPYAVVLGNPARVIKFRFPDDVIARLLEEKWWEQDIDEIAQHLEEYQAPVVLVEDSAASPLVRASVPGRSACAEPVR